MHGAEFRREKTQASSCPLPVGLCGQHLILPAMRCDDRVSVNQGLSHELGGDLPLAGKGQTFLWHVRGLDDLTCQLGPFLCTKLHDK